MIRKTNMRSQHASLTTRGFLHLSVLLALIFLSGCTAQPPGIADLSRLPQEATAYLQPATAETPLISPEEQTRLDAEYNEHFFSPWHQQRASLPPEKAFWGVTDFGTRQGYAENLLSLSQKRWQQLVESMQRENYPSMARPAITVRNTSCRVFPTSRPFFFDPRQAGEGYPFDYFQNSALWTGTPLLITHVSADGSWFFAEAGFVAGWLPTQDVAWANEDFRTNYQNGSYAAVLRDELTFRDVAGQFLTQTHIGAIFPVVAQTGTGLRILVPLRDAGGNALARPAEVSFAAVAVKPLPLQPARIAELADRMLGQLYGWGGLYENRDCSSTLRDLFTPFGIWLPRSSEKQAKNGGVFYGLTGLDNTEKRDRLLKQGIPFYTLVWLKGHIGLYLGADPASGEPLLLHNLWGIRTKGWDGREGRILVGRLAITSLRPGEERWEVENGRFYDRILGMTILPGIGPVFQGR